MINNNCILNSVDLVDAKYNLKKRGYYLSESVYSKDFCDSIISFINSYNEDSNTELHYNDTELRIWNPHKYNCSLNKFNTDASHLLSSILNKQTKILKLLAIRNNRLIANDTESHKGRWHIDSFFDQIKIFLFLNDTDENSGPLEFIPDTFKSSFKLKALLKGEYLRFSDFLSRGKRKYQQLDEDFIKNKLMTNSASIPVICTAGSLLIVNTSIIHRARPCTSGKRYALTAYFQ